jgi:penicillin-binding protein-related factor A (putative recombinase)
MANGGKQFEVDFKTSAENQNVDINRIYDNVGGYAGIKNICDFIAYQYPNIFYLELKCYSGKSIPVNAVTDHQYTGLLKKSKISGAVAGVILRYEDFTRAFFIEINKFQEYKEDNSRPKSIPIEWAEDNGIELPVLKQNRVTAVYDVKSLFSTLSEMEGANNG